MDFGYQYTYLRKLRTYYTSALQEVDKASMKTATIDTSITFY